jgi:murein DD-endopeptidase MepM/ murein hydrolase activator NlpD
MPKRNETAHVVARRARPGEARSSKMADSCRGERSNHLQIASRRVLPSQRHDVHLVVKLAGLIAPAVLLLAARPVLAQDPTQTPTVPATQTPAATSTPLSGPIYIVQSGDNLSLIASRFGVSLDDLMGANGLADANAIFIGQQLIIPGLEGITGFLVTDTIEYGDSFRSMARRHQADPELLHRLNKITSPAELYVGSGLVLQQESETADALTNHTGVSAGETLLEAAVRSNSDAWTISTVNGLPGTWDAVPADALYLPGEAPEGASGAGLPPALRGVSLRDLPFIQGKTAEIVVAADAGVELSGTLVDKPLNFFTQDDGTQIALQGVHAMLDPGPYPLKIEATLPDGSRQAFEQNVLVLSGYYPQDPMLIVPPETIDPVVAGPELQQVMSLVTPATATKQWQGLFDTPAPWSVECFQSRFGNRRAYNGGQYDSFHSGLDFCGGVGLPINAPADGTVVFAGPLTVRGNATIIDHGWGIYTGFWHQSEIMVKAGDRVSKGQQIGVVGGTGRVTGAHLHWEVWANGVQVDPMDWLNNIYP